MLFFFVGSNQILNDMADMVRVISSENVTAIFPCSDIFYLGVICRYSSTLQLTLWDYYQGISVISDCREHWWIHHVQPLINLSLFVWWGYVYYTAKLTKPIKKHSGYCHQGHIALCQHSIVHSVDMRLYLEARQDCHQCSYCLWPDKVVI